MREIPVLLATTWNTACGIAEHSKMLIAAVETADNDIGIDPRPEALDPAWVLDHYHGPHDDCTGRRPLTLLHLNYHRALHSRWTPEDVRRFEIRGVRVIVTFHDTFGELPPDQLSYDLCRHASAFIVHEPCEGLAACYWRMGVPEWALPEAYDWSGWSQGRPILGTVGFPFPWKNYDEVAKRTKEAGWAFLLIAPEATAEQIKQWRTWNPWTQVISTFPSQLQVVSYLAGCDATAFCYTCANSGQSGAVLQGIAARKPVFAFETCRQFRALVLAESGRSAAAAHPSLIRWGETFDDLTYFLESCPIGRVDPRSVALAERDSWSKLGQNYAALYRGMLP